MENQSPQSASESTEFIRGEIAQLKERLDSRIPISDLLVKIHKDLYEKPEVFGLISDEEIAVIIGAIQTHTRQELIVSKEKPKVKKKYSTDDLDL